MALEYSRAFRNFIQGYGSKRQALEGGVIDIWDGSGVVPASPNDAATGVKLVRCTLASGAWTSEVLSMGTITLTGVAGTCTDVTVDSISILDATVTFDTDLTTTATALALAINNTPHVRERYFAYSSGAVVYVRALHGSGTTPNGFALVSTTAGGLTGTDVNLGTGASGVASVNGFSYDAPVNGVFARDGVMSGVVLATGYAAYFRIIGSVVDGGGADAAPWNQIRIQGTCGTSGADYNMDTTYLIVGATHTIDTWTETLAE
jgi:hypothetical protein